jgi:hypothetical protein
VYHNEIYKFASDHSFIWGICTIRENWILKYVSFKQNSGTVNDFKWKSHKLQSCRSPRVVQLWFKVCLTLFEKVMNFIVLQHKSNRWWKWFLPLVRNTKQRWKMGSHHCRMVTQTGGNDRLSPPVRATGCRDNHPYFTNGLSHEPVVKIISLTVCNTNR